MRKFVFTLVTALSLITLSAHAQILYKISGNGLTKPSYLLGTFHLAKSSFVDSIPGFRQAFDQVDQVYGELIMGDMNTPDNAMKMMSAMMLPDGENLKSYFTDDEFERLNKTMRDYMQMDLSSPIALQSYGRMKPAALNTVLSLLIYSRLLEGVNSNDAIDSHVQEMAKEKGKNVGGLEGIDDQTYALFNSIPLSRQAKLLMCLIDHMDYTVDFSKKMIDAYYLQDLKLIESLMNEKIGDGCDSTDEENEVLISGRNKAWIKKIPAIIAEKPTMIVVGAAHLVDKEGLIQLLKTEGYTVEGVTASCCQSSCCQ